MRIVPIIVCASLAGACFATEELKVGELQKEAPSAPQDSGLLDDASSSEAPQVDGGTYEDATVPSTTIDAASQRPRSDEEDEEEVRAMPSDAGMAPDARADASSEAGTFDASVVTEAGASDAGSDAARSLLCTLEPWHCL